MYMRMLNVHTSGSLENACSHRELSVYMRMPMFLPVKRLQSQGAISLYENANVLTS